MTDRSRDAAARGRSRSWCDVCSGRGTVRLALRPKITMPFSDEVSTELCVSHKDFLCPNCAPAIQEERLHVSLSLPKHYPNEMKADVRGHAIRAAAHSIVDELLKEKLLTVEEFDQDEYQTAVRVTLGVVAPRHVATFQERVAARQDVIARKVVDRACRQIFVWGSDYSGPEGHIRKQQAADELRAALNAELADAKRTDQPRAAAS